MKLVAIFCVWHDWDMLKYSVRNIKDVVDAVFVIGSEKSNYGEVSPIPHSWRKHIYNWEPDSRVSISGNETNKRNFGLKIARDNGYTHFICMDADEFYVKEDFLRERDNFGDAKGKVCATQVYFKSPKLTIGLDTTRVPFIQKLTPGVYHQFNRAYPFAWENGEIKIDPTRSLTTLSDIEWSPIIMHHYSYVRKDINVKIRNSTARTNIERSTVLQDFANAKEGYFCQFYGKPLARSQVDFDLPEF